MAGAYFIDKKQMVTFWFNNFLFTEIENNKLMIGTGINSITTANALKSNDDAPQNLIIPRKANGKTVTIVGRNSFSSCSNIKTIFIPKNIESVQCYAFENNPSLVKIFVERDAKTMFQDNSLDGVRSSFTIYFGGTRCQSATATPVRRGSYTLTAIVRHEYSCKTFLDFRSTDIIKIDDSFFKVFETIACQHKGIHMLLLIILIIMK